MSGLAIDVSCGFAAPADHEGRPLTHPPQRVLPPPKGEGWNPTFSPLPWGEGGRRPGEGAPEFSGHLDFSEVSAWDLFDANVCVGRSGVHGELALEAPDLLVEMDRFGIRQALASHFAAEEYDAEEGNRALASDLAACDLVGRRPRLVPAWAALPDPAFLRQLALRSPRAVRLSFGAKKHNFSGAPWCSGELYDYLQKHSILTVIGCEDLEWDALVHLLENFPRLRVLLLETGYRADRYLFPLLRRHTHLYFDTSTYVAHRQLESFVERFGPERVVFGSRLPLYTPAAALGVLATARIAEEARLAIAGGTLRRLLGSAAA